MTARGAARQAGSRHQILTKHMVHHDAEEARRRADWRRGENVGKERNAEERRGKEGKGKYRKGEESGTWDRRAKAEERRKGAEERRAEWKRGKRKWRGGRKSGAPTASRGPRSLDSNGVQPSLIIQTCESHGAGHRVGVNMDTAGAGKRDGTMQTGGGRTGDIEEEKERSTDDRQDGRGQET